MGIEQLNSGIIKCLKLLRLLIPRLQCMGIDVQYMVIYALDMFHWVDDPAEFFVRNLQNYKEKRISISGGRASAEKRAFTRSQNRLCVPL